MIPFIRTAVLATTLAASITTAAPFTYQGQLQDSGAPADGIFDFRFELFDAAIGGTQIGPTLGIENTPVSEGTFQETLDFGDGIFNGTDYYLHIQVREGTSGGLFTPLLPRTQINATPKAQHATTADTVLNPQWAEAPGILNYGDGNDRVFVNRSSPITGSEYFGVHSDLPGFVGMYTSGPADAQPFYGYSVDGAINAYTYFKPSDNSWILVHNGLDALTVDSSQNLIVRDDVSADNFNYNSPKTSYISVAGDSFVSGSNDPFFAALTNGGAYISNTGQGWLVAPIQLPHGATVTQMRVYCTDNAVGNSSIVLQKLTHGVTGFSTIASVNTNEVSGFDLELIDTTITDPLVDNNLYHYHLRVSSNSWPGNSSLNIESVVVQYTTTQAD